MTEIQFLIRIGLLIRWFTDFAHCSPRCSRTVWRFIGGVLSPSPFWFWSWLWFSRFGDTEHSHVAVRRPRGPLRPHSAASVQMAELPAGLGQLSLDSHSFSCRMGRRRITVRILPFKIGTDRRLIERRACSSGASSLKVWLGLAGAESSTPR